MAPVSPRSPTIVGRLAATVAALRNTIALLAQKLIKKVPPMFYPAGTKIYDAEHNYICTTTNGLVLGVTDILNSTLYTDWFDGNPRVAGEPLHPAILSLVNAYYNPLTAKLEAQLS